MDISKLDAFTRGYMECALWSSNDNSDESGGDPLDDNYEIDNIAEETLAQMVKDCADFQEFHADDLILMYEEGFSESDAGYDFWLTRNGHGAGFWDRGLGDVGERLSKASRPYGSIDLMVGDDGKVYG